MASSPLADEKEDDVRLTSLPLIALGQVDQMGHEG
jgi:hypothetical protein